MVLGYRLVVDPGLDWALDASATDLLLSFGGALGGLAAARAILPEARIAARVVLETGFAAAAALFVDVLLTRWLDAHAFRAEHWSLAMQALPWLVVALVQLARFRLGGPLRWIRAGLAALAGLAWLGATLVTLTLASPLVFGGRVSGPWVFDTLLVAYGLPALVLLVGLRLVPMHWLLRWGATAMAALLATAWIGWEIRRWWQGDNLGVYGVAEGELYAYTVAMMLAAAVLLGRALIKGSKPRRWAAMALIAATIAKVFLIDASGLAGLTRVVSFLALGLALAGVAWLNRWAASREVQGNG